MAEFNAEITGFTHRSGDTFSRIPAKTLGGIIVRPPVEAKELFKDAVLGQEAFGVELGEVMATTESTTFIAKSSRGTVEDQRADIAMIAERINRLANMPGSVIQMIDENPFPRPQERW